MPSSMVSIDDEVSSTMSSSSSEEDEEYRIAQQEWEESLQQLQQLVAVVLLPFFGKWMGRRFSQIGSFFFYSKIQELYSTCAAYARYLRLGLSKAFFFGEKWRA
jgi:hypothetical protein